MSELLFLGLEIVFRLRAGVDFAGHTLDHLHSSLLERRNLIGIVRQQADLSESQGLQHFAGQSEIAMIGFEAEPLVSFHGVETSILQLVGLQLRHEPDAPSFFLFVDQNARTFLGYHGESHLKLLATIAAQRAKDVASQALRVHAHQGRLAGHVAHDKRNGFFARASGAVAGRTGESVDAKLSPPRGEVRRSQLSN